ncbi:polyamine transporter 1 [Phialemonium atrogriseum]|uniref:Polyamine transporter 1 n=1 Tax=Phialemonium atrogriseum TaxID=1093897 RepID=A0AAJ0BVH2_9PEZI|nr:polyamine transporter 1 [Phialemonium atrogriseum]KAK1765233.1 polyamine transporter 1 [Phialemonium atrogriseum]
MDEKNCPRDGKVITTTAEVSLDQQSAQLSIDVENAGENVDSVSNQDNIVDWDGPEDPQNPQNWTSTKKWTIIILISTITFNQAMSSTIFAPGVPQTMRDFHSDDQALATSLVSIYVIGLAVGPLFLSPLSELYGRTPLMHASNFLFLISAIACGLSVNIPMLLVFRLIMGVSTISLGGGYVADMMEPERRGRAMNVWTVGPVLAPVVGPIAGGFISLKTSWRWTFGLVGIIGAVLIVACFIFLPETHPPRLLELKTRRLRKETGNPQLRSKYDIGHSPLQLLRLSLMRPTKMLLRCPIIGIVSLFLAIAYSYMYLMFTTFTDVFETTYGFNAGEAGLAYLGLGIGSLVGQYTLDLFMKWHMKEQLAKNGKRQPEDQLPPLVAAGFLLSTGLFWYGWSLEYKVHWIVPLIGTSLCGISISYFFLAVQTYLVEAYTLYAASALAANTLVRCIFGVTVPLAGPHLYSRLGLGWGNTLLGFLALTVAPASLWLLKHGERIRNDPRFIVKL